MQNTQFDAINFVRVKMKKILSLITKKKENIFIIYCLEAKLTTVAHDNPCRYTHTWYIIAE